MRSCPFLSVHTLPFKSFHSAFLSPFHNAPKSALSFKFPLDGVMNHFLLPPLSPTRLMYSMSPLLKYVGRNMFASPRRYWYAQLFPSLGTFLVVLQYSQRGATFFHLIPFFSPGEKRGILPRAVAPTFTGPTLLHSLDYALPGDKGPLIRSAFFLVAITDLYPTPQFSSAIPTRLSPFLSPAQCSLCISWLAYNPSLFFVPLLQFLSP